MQNKATQYWQNHQVDDFAVAHKNIEHTKQDDHSHKFSWDHSQIQWH
jgi:hypothetical protein